MDLMKIAHRVNSSSLTVLGSELRTAQRRFGKTAQGSNEKPQAFSDALRSLRGISDMRLELRSQVRHLHLARAYLKGTPYKQVENSVRKGNKPSVSMIREALEDFDMYFYEEYIHEWLQEEAA